VTIMNSLMNTLGKFLIGAVRFALKSMQILLSSFALLAFVWLVRDIYVHGYDEFPARIAEGLGRANDKLMSECKYPTEMNIWRRDYDKEIRACTDLLTHTDDIKRSRREMAEVFYHRGEAYDAKVRTFQMGCTIISESGVPFLSGKLCEPQEQEALLRLAMNDYSQGIFLDRDNESANDEGRSYHSRSRIEFKFKDLDSALQDANKAVELGRLGLFFRVLEYAGVAHNYAFDGQNWSYHSNRGDIYQAKGDCTNAINDYTEAMNRVGWKDTSTYFNRAKCYAKLGNFDMAKADISTIKSISEKDYELFSGLALKLAEFQPIAASLKN